MFADELRRAAEAAPRFKLPEIAKLLWQAVATGSIAEAEAEALDAVIQGRQGDQLGHPSHQTDAKPPGSRRTSVGSRPRTDASMERRRRWAASGRLPPQIASRFTLAETAVLSVVAAETARRGDCRLAHDHLAAVVGVSKSTVKATLKRARALGLITIEERPVTAWRNLSNVVRIVSPEWTSWLRLARRSPRMGGGVNSSTRTPTDRSNPVESGLRKTKKGCRQAAGDPIASRADRIRATGRAT